MKERLTQLLDLEQLTPSKFADIIGVQRSSVSHVISGRNKPSFDFIQKTLTAFPGLNAEWLILGKGTLYDQMGRGTTGNLFDAPSDEDPGQFPLDIPDKGAEKDFPEESKPVLADHSEEIPGDLVPEGSRSPGKIVQVMVFYEDDTFKTYKPSK